MKEPRFDDEYLDSVLDFGDLEAKYSVQLEQGFKNILIVDELPIVDETKRGKLLTVLRKHLSSTASLKNDENAIYMPSDENGKSQGFAFVEYNNAEDANLVLKNMNGFKLDKSHTLTVTRLSDFESYMRSADTLDLPEKEAFVPKEHLKDWLKDDAARDQLACVVEDDVKILWNEKAENPEEAYSRPHWTETYVQWSPKGTYLATFHQQGVALWGGPSWQKVARFVCPMVKVIHFSPNETYFTALSSEPFNGDNNVGVWEISTGKLLRSFSYDPKESGGMEWPLFKWSNSESYIARCTSGTQISVYEVPSMRLLDNKSIKIDGVKTFSWSPKDNYIAYWVPELDNSPARVSVQEIPSKNIVRSKNLFNVTSAILSWQSNGDYLACRLERATKTKKSTYPSLEVFRMREKNIPIDVLELKHAITELAWEPNSDRFITFSQESANKTAVQIYRMEIAQGKALQGQIKLVKSLERKSVNQIHWSPKGRFVVFAGLKSFNGELEFFDADDMITLANGEHYIATDVEWDPTGRYILSSTSYWRHENETGYQLWDFKGTLIHKNNMAKMKQIMWRPRPASMLPFEEQKRIRKNLREFSKQFEEDDAKASSRVSREVELRRRRLIDEWISWRKEVQAVYERGQAEREKLLVGLSNLDDASEEIEEIVEEVIDEVEEIIE